MKQTPAEFIRQRRAQMLIHSHLYYRMDAPIISDSQWQHWADELGVAQAAHPQPIGFYDREFADWNGSTGMHLPSDGWVIEKADLVRRIAEDYRKHPPIKKTPPAPAVQAPAPSAGPPMQASLF
jgi:hypothetical protein